MSDHPTLPRSSWWKGWCTISLTMHAVVLTDSVNGWQLFRVVHATFTCTFTSLAASCNTCDYTTVAIPASNMDTYYMAVANSCHVSQFCCLDALCCTLTTRCPAANTWDSLDGRHRLHTGKCARTESWSWIRRMRTHRLVGLIV